MNNSEVVKLLSERMGKSQGEIKRLMKLIIGGLRKALDEGRQFNIPSLGTFSSTMRKERKAYNPRDKNMMILPKKQVVTFRPGTALKNKVKQEGVDDES